jgi:hypothetical protein
MNNDKNKTAIEELLDDPSARVKGLLIQAAFKELAEQNQALSKCFAALQAQVSELKSKFNMMLESIINTQGKTAQLMAVVFDGNVRQRLDALESASAPQVSQGSTDHPSMQTDKEVQQVTNEYVNLVLWLITDGKYEGYDNKSLGKLIRERLDSRKSGAAKETSMIKSDTVTFEDNGKLFQMSAEDLDKARAEQAKRKWNDAPVKFSDYQSFREISGTMDEFVAKMKTSGDHHGAKIDLSHAIDTLKELESFPFKLPSNRKSLQAAIEILEKHNKNGKK